MTLGAGHCSTNQKMKSKDVLEQHVVALEQLCKDDGCMGLERVPVGNV